MSEDDIKIISKEDYQNEELSDQKIIFDNTIFEQIKGKELDLSVEKNTWNTYNKKLVQETKRWILCS